MTSQEIQDKYSKLCTELGDKVLKLLDLKDQHSRVSSEIEELETMVQAYRKVRDELAGLVPAEFQTPTDERNTL